MPHRFDPKNWERLVGEERRRMLDPERVLDLIGIAPGATVADVGAGPGFFTLPLAERVGAQGRVYALDVSARMLELLRDRQPPPNVVTKLVSSPKLPLVDGSIDLLLLAFVFHELDAPEAMLADMRRVLKPDGRLALLEWVPRDEERGPPRHVRVSESESERALVAAGFAIDLREALNPSHYMLVAARSPRNDIAL